MIIKQLESSEYKDVSFTAENANEGMALERLRRAIHSPISKYSFVIGKGDTIVLRLSIFELVRFMGSLK